MAKLGSILIDIVANTSQLKTDLDGARKELGSFRGNVEGMMGSVSRLGGSLLRLGGVSVTLAGIGKLGKDAAVSFAQAERQSLRLDAVLRATGNSAGISAKELRAMAEALSRTSLFDDEAILAAISQLQTFENISGQTFKNAIKLSVDLASLWDGDVSSAALALGKALQSPAEAASLLGKAKVRLTEEEKKAIEAFLKLNDVAGAQAHMLQVLEGRVGGVAEGEATGLAGAFHRLKLKIDDARKSLVGFVVGSADGKGMGLADAIQGAFTKGAGLAPLITQPKLPDLTTFIDPTMVESISQEVGGLTSLAGIDPKRITQADIARLQELGNMHALALRIPNLELEKRVRLARELKSIQDALTALGLPLSSGNLGAPRDLSRMGATAEEEAALRTAIGNSKLSSAMTGVGGERGLSPFGEDKVRRAAELWRETWVNAIRGAQEEFADFFESIGREGFNLVSLFTGIADSIRRTLAQLASQQVVQMIFGAAFSGVTGPGGANRGNLTQSQSVSASPSVVHVHQAVTFAPSFIDGASGAAWLRSNKAVIAGAMLEAVNEAPKLAQYIVAQGMRR